MSQRPHLAYLEHNCKVCSLIMLIFARVNDTCCVTVIISQVILMLRKMTITNMAMMIMMTQRDVLLSEEGEHKICRLKSQVKS